MTTDGTIQWVAECHCFSCQQGAMGLKDRDPATDLKDRGWEKRVVELEGKRLRRWHCHSCIKERERGGMR